MKEHFGVKLPGLVPRYVSTLQGLPGLVAELERQGWDDVFDGEHILFGPGMVHPGGAGTMVHGRTEQRSDRADSLVTFSAIAAHTTTIEMFSGVLLAGAHNFAILARQAATLDVLSGGRFVLGVGAGWFAGEFAAMGIPPKERDARLEETIRACQELWSSGLSSFEGRWIRFQDVLSEPAPTTAGGVPVWFGGNGITGPTARRVATLGHGWIAREAADVDEVARSIETIDKTCSEFGRDSATVGFRASLSPPPPGAGTPPRTVEQVLDDVVPRAQRLAGLGITHFSVPVNYYQLELAELAELLAALRRA